jgi:hypothetical protein
MSDGSRPAHGPHGSHETRDISMRAVVWTALGFMGLGALGLLLSGLYFGILDRGGPEPPPRSIRHAVAEAAPLPPEPRLQMSPQSDLKAMREQERELLNGYAWVDRPGGRVRIPIDRAMEIVATRGAR